MDKGSQLIRLAVFGQPVAQSLSPRIHRLFALQCDLAVDYRAIEADDDNFTSLVSRLADEGGRGCNITAPFKHQAWKLSSRCSDDAERAEAVNTLAFNGAGDWFGANTDGQGLVNDLQSIPGFTVHGACVCLLGAGGAASGVLAALMKAGPAAVVLVNRTRQKALDLAQRHLDLGDALACTPEEAGAHGPFDLVINATSLGHSGAVPGLSTDWLSPVGCCYDMNYGSAADPLKRHCTAKGIPYSDGLGMLVGQAALSFEIWTGFLPETGGVLSELRRAP